MYKKNQIFNKRLFITIALTAIMLIVTLAVGAIKVDFNAEAAEVNSGFNSVGELVSGKRFNETNLNNLYAQLSGTATYDSVKKKADDQTATSTSSTNQLVKASQFYARTNGNHDILVTFGGYVWTPTALSLANNTAYFDGLGNATDANCNVKQGDVVLTLMLYESTTTSKYNNYYNEKETKYTGNLYSTSTLRNVALNAGGYIVNSTGTGVTKVDKSSDNIYAKFTMDDVSGSLTNFIVQPKYVKYQADQKWYIDGNPNTPAGACGNESYVYDPNAKYAGIGKSICGNERYSDWKEDYLWAPSLNEAAPHLPGKTRDLMWGLSTSQGFSTDYYWSRVTSSSPTSYQAHAFTDTEWITEKINVVHYVRPCMHLNLSALDRTFLANSQQITSVYNGEEQDYFNATDANWYNEDLFSADNANVEVEYFTSTGSPLSTQKPIESGSYTVALTVKNEKYAWKGTSDRTKNVTFVINPKPISAEFNTNSTPPTVAAPTLYSRDADLAPRLFKIRYTDGNGHNATTPPTGTNIYKAQVEIDETVSKNYTLDSTYSVEYIGMPEIMDLGGIPTYDGDIQQLYLSFANSNIDEIEITVPDEFRAKGLDYSNSEIDVTQAGDYYLILNIKKKDGTVKWDTRDTDEKRLEFTIKKADISIDIKSLDGSANIVVTKGEKAQVKLDSMQKVCGDDIINFNIKAVMSRSSAIERLVYSNLTIDKNTSFPYEIELDIHELAATDWKLEIV
ncbi:MAG: hypothetical protein K2M75_00455, partial [Clostridia bacterium]|nr:hypothetical protein [Clostridia bacterium]